MSPHYFKASLRLHGPVAQMPCKYRDVAHHLENSLAR